MKIIKNLVSMLMVLIVVLIASTTNVMAASSLPTTVKSDSLRQVEYIKNFPVIIKTADNGKYYIYCMNMNKTYAANVVFAKTNTVKDGFVYILNNKPNTGNKDKDFYITQMAVWYYEDYLNNNNFNLEEVVKQYILSHRTTDEICKAIYNLYQGARDYKAPVSKLSIEKPSSVVFAQKDGYYVSQEVKIVSANLSGNISYSLSNAPVGTKIVKGATANTVQVKVPVSAIPAGKKLTVTLKVAGKAVNQKAYYYYNSSKYQDMLFQDTLDTTVDLSDSFDLTVIPKTDFDVNISKTDVTQQKEIPGAKLELRKADNTLVESWTSTSTAHKVTLKAGEYKLTETIAPTGYKLSKTTIEFKVDSYGIIYGKNSNGEYVKVSKINMINELLDTPKFKVEISKTDVTQQKEIPGATLVLKQDNKTLYTWVSSTNSYKLQLEAGKYSLTETIAPTGYKLSSTTIEFMLDSKGNVYEKDSNGVYKKVSKINMINELLDVVSIVKKDSKTDKVLAGAKLVIKDIKGNVVKEFTSTTEAFKLELEEGDYTLTEISAPTDYVLSKEVVYFRLLKDGTLKVKNSKGEYVDSAYVTFYNVKKVQETVPVDKTDLNSTGYIIIGLALLAGGAYFAKKTIKEC